MKTSISQRQAWATLDIDKHKLDSKKVKVEDKDESGLDYKSITTSTHAKAPQCHKTMEPQQQGCHQPETLNGDKPPQDKGKPGQAGDQPRPHTDNIKLDTARPRLHKDKPRLGKEMS